MGHLLPDTAVAKVGGSMVGVCCTRPLSRNRRARCSLPAYGCDRSIWIVSCRACLEPRQKVNPHRKSALPHPHHSRGNSRPADPRRSLRNLGSSLLGCLESPQRLVSHAPAPRFPARIRMPPAGLVDIRASHHAEGRPRTRPELRRDGTRAPRSATRRRNGWRRRLHRIFLESSHLRPERSHQWTRSSSNERLATRADVRGPEACIPLPLRHSNRMVQLFPPHQ